MSYTLLEATLRNPNLARLQALARDSSRYLTQVLPLSPATLRVAVKAGPIEQPASNPQADTPGKVSWCLIASNNASASTLRQVLPTLLQHLQTEGHPVASIRLSVEKSSTGSGGH